MQCNFIEKNLVEYIEGNLSVQDERRIRAHLNECAKCQYLVEKSTLFWDGLESVTPEKVPPRFYWGIQRKLLNNNSNQFTYMELFRKKSKTFVPAFAAVALLFGLFLGNFFGRSLYKNVYSQQSVQVVEENNEYVNFELFNNASDVALINTYYESYASLD